MSADCQPEVVQLQSLVTAWRQRFETREDALERHAAYERSRIDALSVDIERLRAELEYAEQSEAASLDEADLLREQLRQLGAAFATALDEAADLRTQVSQLRAETAAHEGELESGTTTARGLSRVRSAPGVRTLAGRLRRLFRAAQ